jgi:RHS repeat-associated protein
MIINYNFIKRRGILSVLLLLTMGKVYAQTQVTSPMTSTPAAGSYFSYSSIQLNPGFSFTAAAGQSLQLYIANPDCQPLASNLSFNQNFIRVSEPRVPITTEAGLLNRSTCELMQTVQYFDGLGRSLQTVQVKGSPAGNDLVQPIAYDQFGREAVKYLPYALTSANVSDGSYKTNALTPGAGQASFYASPPTGVSVIPDPSAATAFEQSPLNRVIEQGAPGVPWQLSTSGISGSGHTVKIAYGRNAATDVVLWTVNTSGTGATGTSNYTAGQLFKTITTDENGNNTITYKDKLSRIVCKQVQSGPSTYLSTNYVYNDLNNLAYVIPPIPASITYPTSFAETDAVFIGFIYGYHYDGRNRVTEKKIPGKGWEFAVYNALDQPVFTQDANQRSQTPQVWTYIKYDALGRVVITGIWSSSGITGSTGDSSIPSPSRVLEQWLVSWVNSQTSLWETVDNTTSTGYATMNPTGSILTVNYYDNYNFPGNPYSSINTAVTNPTPTGLLTGMQMASLKPDGSIGTTLWTIPYYDNLGRVVQTSKEYYLSGAANTNNYDAVQTTYSFDNTVASATKFHYTAGTQTLKIADTYNYDHMGRKTQTWEAITVGSNTTPPSILLNQADYNEIGQVKTQHLHSTNNGSSFLQNTGYSYNERGWLNTINSPSTISATQVFGEQLLYNTGTTPQFNGNISGISWQTMVPAGMGLVQTQQSYAYTYDNLNRLTLANYTTTGATGKFNEQATYDNMGNITGLTRTNSTTAGVYMNNFTYNYSSGGIGNQLWSITDAGTAAQNGTYTYDVNGNVNKDTRKQITGLTYNLLDLPATVTRTPGNISYTYDATGNKLEKVSGSITRDYTGGIEYNNGSIEFINTVEGRAIPSGSTYVYEYYLKDHLGNTRAAIKQDGSIIQVQDYYAFGEEMNPGNSLVPSPNNQYLYNGKELQSETGDIDYGARYYDPVIARWNTVDPLAEKSTRWSPYNYVRNNPIRNIDPDGMDAESDALQEQWRIADLEASGLTAYGYAAGITAQTPPKGDKKTLGNQTVNASYVNNKWNDVVVDNGSDDAATYSTYQVVGDPIEYGDGTVQNYADGNKTAAVFMDKHGNLIVLPGVQVSSSFVTEGSGATPGNRKIYLSTARDANGQYINRLLDLEHEYGHFLDAYNRGSFTFAITTDIPSSISAWRDSEEVHNSKDYELRATRLAIKFFGPNSDIAKKNVYTKHLNDK